MRFDNWVLDPDKYLNKEDAGKLLAIARRNAELAFVNREKVAVRDYLIIHLAMTTGLRVMEIAELKCSDLFLRDVVSSVLVRKGKGGKKRLVYFSGDLVAHCKKYLAWKQQMGESTEANQPLLLSSNTGDHMSTRAIQKSFKRCARNAGLPPLYAIHCLRHTYACFLLKASKWNLRLVQKQLGHSRIITTQVYADVMMPEIKTALDRLYQ